MGLDPLTSRAESRSCATCSSRTHRAATSRAPVDRLPTLWALLDKAGYAGFVAAEYRERDTPSSVGWLDAWRGLVAARDSR
jgi:hypothetical protein